MGLILKAAGANFEANAVSYIPPVAEGLLYWGFLNDSIEKLKRNFAPEGAPVSIVGAPPFTGKGAVLDKLNHIQTQVQQTPSLTFIAVGNPVTDGEEQGAFISNYTSVRAGGLSGASFGVSLYCSASEAKAGTFDVLANVSSFSGVDGAASTLRQATLSNLDITKPAFLALTFDSVEKVVRAHNLANGVTAQAAAYADPVDMGITPFRVGGMPLSTYINKPRNIHFAAIYNRKLSEAELGLIYTRIKAYLATRGVVV